MRSWGQGPEASDAGGRALVEPASAARACAARGDALIEGETRGDEMSVAWGATIIAGFDAMIVVLCAAMAEDTRSSLPTRG